MRSLGIAALAAGVVLAGSAQAAVYTLTFDGTVASGVDALGLFGAPGADLAGDVFSAFFQFNDPSTSIGHHEISGGPFSGTPDPTVATQVTIGGVTINLPSFDNRSYGATYAVVAPGVIEGMAAVDGPSFSLNAVSFAPSLAGVVVTVPADHPFPAQWLDIPGEGEIFFDLKAGTVSPILGLNIGIPEPASWSLLIAGFGGVGLMLRRKRDALAALSRG